MRCFATTALALGLLSCRPYDNYSPVASQSGLLPPDRFARLGREQAELVAIGRSLAAWRMTDDPAEVREQTRRAACFARRFPEVETVDADELGFRLTVHFKSGWRAAAVPVDDGIAPSDTPGLPALLPAPQACS